MDKEAGKKRLRRYLNGTYTKQEVETLQEVLCDAEKKEIVDELACETWEEACLGSQDVRDKHAEYVAEAQKLLEGMNLKRRTVGRRFLYVASIAASVIIVFFSIQLLWHTESAPPTLMEVHTSFGEKRRLTLPDGSRIALNSCTRLQYPVEFKGKQREVHLDGEAYFEIAPDKEKPFIVKSGAFDVQVLGTQFDVKSYSEDEQMVVEVKSGKVQVNLPEAVIRLKRQEKIIFNPRSGEHGKKKGKENVANWVNGNLYFDRTPIRDVAHELERLFNCQIVFEEGQEFNNLISGEHDNQTLESILESLCYICNIQSKKENGRIILYK